MALSGRKLRHVRRLRERLSWVTLRAASAKKSSGVRMDFDLSEACALRWALSVIEAQYPEATEAPAATDEVTT